MEDFHRMLFFWRSVVAYFTLLGVLLILLGVAVAGWLTAEKTREKQMSK